MHFCTVKGGFISIGGMIMGGELFAGDFTGGIQDGIKGSLVRVT